METNKIYNMDNVAGLSQLPDECIDLVVTSPPYDDLRTYHGFCFDLPNLVKQLYRTLKQGGVIVWVVADQTKNGSETGTSFRQALTFMEAGFNLHDTMIWEKTAMLPTQDRYYNVFEYMFVFSKGKPKTMNFIEDKPNVNGGRIQRKDKCINKGDNIKGESFFVRKDVGRRTNIWRISIGKNAETQGHPAPFPEQLATDHIISWSNEGDLVCDPFIGSGTTAKCAKKLSGNYIGFEISKEYCEIAEARLEQATLF